MSNAFVLICSDLIYASPILLRDALALFMNNCLKGSQSTGQITSTIQSGPFPVRPAPKKHKDFILVNHWTRKEFRHACVVYTNAQRGETNGSVTSTQCKRKCRHPHKGSDTDNMTSHFYLEDADGMPVSEEQIVEMS